MYMDLTNIIQDQCQAWCFMAIIKYVIQEKQSCSKHIKGYYDGGQLRDFIYVKDLCTIVMFFIEHEEINGLFNVGTGKARSFCDLAKTIFKSMNANENIEYIDMPNHLQSQYQYYTQAEIKKSESMAITSRFIPQKAGQKIV